MSPRQPVLAEEGGGQKRFDVEAARLEARGAGAAGRVHPTDDTDRDDHGDGDARSLQLRRGGRAGRARDCLHRHLLAPSTKVEVAACCITWLLLLGALLVVFFLGLPRLACAAFVPLLAWVKVRWTAEGIPSRSGSFISRPALGSLIALRGCVWTRQHVTFSGCDAGAPANV